MSTKSFASFIQVFVTHEPGIFYFVDYFAVLLIKGFLEEKLYTHYVTLIYKKIEKKNKNKKQGKQLNEDAIFMMCV